MADSASETITAGLDDLPERLAEYREMGARFAKWRAVIRVGAGLPSRECVRANAEALGRYAVIAQETGLVPIVEPEVLMDGGHDIERCREVTESVLGAVFDQLRSAGCMLTGIVLKPNMVTPGSACPIPADPSQVADLTLAALRRCVPAGVPGIAFLSGGQSGGEACANLNEMARRGPHPWQLSFSFGRALQYPALQIWDGKPSNIPVAQSAFLHRARMSSLAAAGQYSAEAERALI